MANVLSAVQNTVSITQFNRGQAGKIFEEVKKRGTKVVIKNNSPECVLMSPEEYVALMDKLNDAKLLILATERMSHFDPTTLVSQEDIDKQFGITDKDLEGFEQVELE